MNPTKLLRNEHDIIRKGLRILESICQKIEKNENVPSKDIEGMLEFFRVFADKCHHGKEEDVLFPELEKAGMPRKGGPIGVMLIEHDLGRKYVANMVDSLSRKDYKSFIMNAREYINLLNLHIDKENNVLFVMADKYLSEAQQKKVLEEFNRIEAEKIGPQKHEEFHQLINALEKVYL